MSRQGKTLSVKIIRLLALAGLMVASGSMIAIAAGGPPGGPPGAGGGPPAGLDVTPGVEQEFLNMKAKEIQKNTSALALQEQMQSRMMGERMSENFMMDVMQPYMEEIMREKMKSRMSGRMRQK